MEIVNQTENKLLGRKEVEVMVETEGPTLTRAVAKAQLAKKFKVKEDLIIIKAIDSHYGSLNSLVSANLYEKANALEKLTPKYLKERNKSAAPAEEKAPAQEAVASAPVAEEASSEVKE